MDTFKYFRVLILRREPDEDPGHSGGTAFLNLKWLGIPPEELAQVTGENEVRTSLLRLLPQRPDPGVSERWMAEPLSAMYKAPRVAVSFSSV